MVTISLCTEGTDTGLMGYECPYILQGKSGVGVQSLGAEEEQVQARPDSVLQEQIGGSLPLLRPQAVPKVPHVTTSNYSSKGIEG